MLRWLALTLLMIAASASAHERGWFPRTKGECGWVYGRFANYNGSGTRRIWVIGTTHLLYISDRDKHAPSVLDPIASGWHPFREVVYGEFYTCALKRHIDGRMQLVRVTRVRNYTIRAPL